MLSDGSKLTTRTTSYNFGDPTVKTTHSYRLANGTRRTESTTRTKRDKSGYIGVVVIALAAWPWLLNLPFAVEIAIACGWYVVMALVVLAVMAPSQSRNSRIAGVTGLAAAGVTAGALITVALGGGPHSSYQDGYQWGQANTTGILSKTEPSCSQEEMVSNGPVVDPNFFINKPAGDGKPNDNFAQWEAGCQAGALDVVKQFAAPSSS